MSLLEDVIEVLEEIRDSGYLERFPKLGNKVLNVLDTIKTEKPTEFRKHIDCRNCDYWNKGIGIAVYCMYCTCGEKFKQSTEVSK